MKLSEHERSPHQSGGIGSTAGGGGPAYVSLRCVGPPDENASVVWMLLYKMRGLGVTLILTMHPRVCTFSDTVVRFGDGHEDDTYPKVIFVSSHAPHESIPVFQKK